MRTLTTSLPAALTALACVLTGAVALAPVASASPVAASRAAATALPAPGGYVPLATPVRTASLVTVAAQRTVTVRVAGGTTGVPTTEAVAAVQVSALNPTAAGALTVYRNGGDRPETTNVQFNKSKRASGLALVPVTYTSAGQAHVYNNSRGSVQVVVDIVGYYVRAGRRITTAKGFNPIAPKRALNVNLAANRSASPVFGLAGSLPAVGIGALAVTFSAFGASRAGGLLAGAFSENGVPQQVLSWPGGGARAGAFAVLPTDTDGQVTLANLSASTVHLTVDIVGFFVRGEPSVAGRLDTVPTAQLDKGLYPAGTTRTLPVAGHAGVPLRHAGAVVVSLRAGSPNSGSVLASSGTGESVAVQYPGGVRTTNTAIVPLSDAGTIRLLNNGAGDLNLVVDVVGWVLADDLDVPSVSTSRYLDDLRTTTWPATPRR